MLMVNIIGEESFPIETRTKTIPKVTGLCLSEDEKRSTLGGYYKLVYKLHIILSLRILVHLSTSILETLGPTK